MRNIKLTIQYDGTNYSGWQSQKNSVAIQDIVEKAIAKLLGETPRITGAARTDAQVHAAGQVANFKTKSRLSLENIKNGLNRNLPRDIVVTRVNEAGGDFHSQYDAKRKLYRYRIYAGSPVPPFFKDFVTPVKYDLNMDIIREETKVLLGRHDFLSFQGARSVRNNTVRDIYRIDVRRRGRLIEFDIEANGFLYNMVRTIIGTLIDVGRGYLKRGSLKKILEGRDRRLAGSTAPPKGLCLMKVRY
ncbi:tRNA pseudouridine(38-40) synthase TruA [Omnitrophica bacterium]|nr:tRNA pseudouridine(38-40) synthase TruA [Candidatus Omnitrophota bacterium]